MRDPARSAAPSDSRVRIPAWIRTAFLYLGVVIFWVGLWYLAAWRLDEELLLPTPGAVLYRLAELAATSAFWRAVSTSLLRILIGIAAGALAGGLLALATAFVPPLYTLFYPLITVVRSTPVASFIILAYLWIGRDSLPSFISVLLVLPVVWANLHEAIRGTDPALLDMARVFRFSSWKKLRRIYLPASLPAVAASCRTSVGLAWKAGIAAEVLVLPALSIGRNLYDAKLYLETTDLFAWTLTVILLSLLLEWLMMGLMKRFGLGAGRTATPREEEEVANI